MRKPFGTHIVRRPAGSGPNAAGFKYRAHREVATLRPVRSGHYRSVAAIKPTLLSDGSGLARVRLLLSTGRDRVHRSEAAARSARFDPWLARVWAVLVTVLPALFVGFLAAQFFLALH
jgi:hypothetical protein